MDYGVKNTPNPPYKRYGGGVNLFGGLRQKTPNPPYKRYGGG